MRKFVHAAISTAPLLVFACTLSGYAYSEEPRRPSFTAYEAYSRLLESSVTGKNVDFTVPLVEGGQKNIPVTYGGEKEGSTSRYALIYGPDADVFGNWADNLTDSVGFKRRFLKGWTRGELRSQVALDEDAKPYAFSLRGLSEINWDSLSAEDLEAKWKIWLSRAGDRPFTFIEGETRRQLATGTFAGLKGNGVINAANIRWYPDVGIGEKYLEHLDGGLGGWEVHFKPQSSYGDFDRMIDWFRNRMGQGAFQYQGPGHHWLALPKHARGEGKRHEKLTEVMKVVQAYIVLRALEGKTGLPAANHKAMISDQTFRNWEASKDNMSLSEDNFSSQHNFAIELRTGVKSDPTRRLVEMAIVSHYVSDDYQGLAHGDSWTLIPEGRNLLIQKDLQNRFHVTAEEAKLFTQKISWAKIEVAGELRHFQVPFAAPLWHWEEAPFLTAAKRERLKALTADFIRAVGKQKKGDGSSLETALSEWVKISRLEADLRQYVLPQAPLAKSDIIYDPAHPTRAGPAKRDKNRIDVNQIPIGAELTGRFPLRGLIDFEQPDQPDKPDQQGKPKLWLENRYELSQEEKSASLKALAVTLGEKLNPGVTQEPIRAKNPSHGHSLVEIYEVLDSQGRTWTVEWDGVGRSYDKNGVLLRDSSRGGHIEIVTPKWIPNVDDLHKVFEAMAVHGVVPDRKVGGGHLNSDLSHFEGNPRALARLLTTFAENQGMISMLFQSPNRLRAAEPLNFTPELMAKLRDFSGSEAELKKLLYDHKIFNTRLGRKTQYTQLNLTAYFQDVIPEEFLKQDFDIKNDVWRQNFTVDPKVRKLEWRLFDAPRNAHEAALQTKFVKAMLNDALNETSPSSGIIQTIDYETYLKNPNILESDFNSLMARLGLDPKEYKPMCFQSAYGLREWAESESYAPYSQKLRENPKTEAWGKAVPPRPKSKSIRSEDHRWRGKGSEEARALRSQRDLENEKAEGVRQKATGNDPAKLKRTLIGVVSENSLANHPGTSDSGIAGSKLNSKVLEAALFQFAAGSQSDIELSSILEPLIKQANFDRALLQFIEAGSETGVGTDELFYEHQDLMLNSDRVRKTFISKIFSSSSKSLPLAAEQLQNSIDEDPEMVLIGIEHMVRTAKTDEEVLDYITRTNLSFTDDTNKRAHGEIFKQFVSTLLQRNWKIQDPARVRYLESTFDATPPKELLRMIQSEANPYIRAEALSAWIPKAWLVNPKNTIATASKLAKGEFPQMAEAVARTLNYGRLGEEGLALGLEILPRLTRASQTTCIEAMAHRKAGPTFLAEHWGELPKTLRIDALDVIGQYSDLHSDAFEKQAILKILPHSTDSSYPPTVQAALGVVKSRLFTNNLGQRRNTMTPLMRKLVEHENDTVKLGMLVYLERYYEPAMEPILEFLKKDKSKEVRTHATNVDTTLFGNGALKSSCKLATGRVGRQSR